MSILQPLDRELQYYYEQTERQTYKQTDQGNLLSFDTRLSYSHLCELSSPMVRSHYWTLSSQSMQPKPIYSRGMGFHEGLVGYEEAL